MRLKRSRFQCLPKNSPAWRNAVQSGAYSSQGEILRQALDLWESQQDMIDRETAWIKKEHQEGLASGLAEDLSLEELLAQMKAKFQARG
jgi:antitoxin ParD1/3/4